MSSRIVPLALLILFAFAAGADPIHPTYDRAAFQQLMREKLAYMQKVHEAVLTNDFAELSSNLEALRDVAHSATWKMVRTDGYFERSSRFQAAIEDLSEASKHRDSQGLVQPYLRLTAACTDCHNQVRARISD